MTPHSVRLYEGSDPQPLPGSGSTAVVASNDAEPRDEAFQHPTRPTLSLVREHTEEPQPGALDQIALVTMMCEIRHMQREIVDLRKQIKDINYRESF